MNFIWENFVAIMALGVMFASVILQIKHIKFKRGSYKLSAKILDVHPKKFWNQTELQYEYEGKTYQGQARTLNKLVQVGEDTEILVNPLEMTRFNHPNFMQRKLSKISMLKKEYPTIFMVDPNVMIYHFGVIIICVILMSLN